VQRFFGGEEKVGSESKRKEENTLMATLELLRRVRKLLAEKGWIQEDMQSSAGYCLLGAIDEVVPEHRPANLRLRRTVGARIRHEAIDTDEVDESETLHEVITEWNDREWRRRWQVLNLLDRAIAKLEAERALRRIKRAAQHAKAVRTSFECVFQPVRMRGEKCSERK
jgi:hypothetical protein